MAPARKYEFVIALENAGTQPGTQELDIAFEIAGKVKLLERFRDGLTQPSSTHDNGRRQRSPEMTAVIDKAVGLLTQDLGLRKFPLRALQMAGVGNLQTEDEFDQVRESIIQHSFGDPLVGVSSHPSGTQWLAAIKWANRNNVNLVNWNVLIDCVRNSKLP